MGGWEGEKTNVHIIMASHSILDWMVSWLHVNKILIGSIKGGRKACVLIGCVNTKNYQLMQSVRYKGQSSLTLTTVYAKEETAKTIGQSFQE